MTNETPAMGRRDRGWVREHGRAQGPARGRTGLTGSLAVLILLLVGPLQRQHPARETILRSGARAMNPRVPHGTVIHAPATVISPLAVVPVGPFPLHVAVDQRRGHVFVLGQEPTGTHPGRVTMLDSVTGHVLATTIVGRGASALAVDEAADRVVVLHGEPRVPRLLPSTGLGRVDVLDARTGRLLHMTSVGHEAQALLVDEPGARVLVVAVHTLTVLDPASGRVLHTAALGDLSVGYGAVTLDPPSHALFIGGSSSIAECTPPPGQVLRDFVCVTRLDGRTGTRRTRITIRNDNTDTQVVTGLVDDPVTGTIVVYFADGSGLAFVSVLTAATGAVLATTALENGGPVLGASIATDSSHGRAVVVAQRSSANGSKPVMATVVDMRTGRTRGSLVLRESGGPGLYTIGSAVALDTRTGDAIVVTNDGDERTLATRQDTVPAGRSTVTVLDPGGPAVVGEVRAGRGLPDVAVDPRTRRVFVPNSEDGTVSVFRIGS